MIIGTANGYDVVYNEDTDTVYCKRFRCRADLLIRAFESAFDREQLEGDLVMKKFDNEVTLGCLNLTLKDSKQLIKQIKDAKKRKPICVTSRTESADRPV